MQHETDIMSESTDPSFNRLGIIATPNGFVRSRRCKLVAFSAGS